MIRLPQLALLVLAGLCMNASCDREDDDARVYTTTRGLVNGEPWEAERSWGGDIGFCGSVNLSMDKYTPRGLAAQELGVSLYHVQDRGRHLLYDRALNDKIDKNCPRYPDTATALLSTADDDLITAFYDLAPELGECTVDIDSISPAGDYYAGAVNAHFIVRGSPDRRIYELQLPDTVHFEDVRFGIHISHSVP